MTREEIFSLIEGNFNKQEAREVLLNIFSTKLQFHELRNFSSKERLGKADENALIRMQVMKDNISKVVELLSKLDENKNCLKISSSINIQILNEE